MVDEKLIKILARTILEHKTQRIRKSDRMADFKEKYMLN